MYRPVELGGLGGHNIKVRALAMFIHTFLAQAIYPRFTINFYLNELYRLHVLDNKTLPDPGRPPHYSTTFFATIKDVHSNTALNFNGFWFITFD